MRRAPGCAAPAVDAALARLGPFGLAARLPGIRDALGRVALASLLQRYGLGGGIVFATLDYRCCGSATSRGNGVNNEPDVGSPLRAYLWWRLLEATTGTRREHA